MIRLIGHTIAKLALVIVSAVILLSGCTTPKGEGFAIYLTKEDIPPAKMEALSHVDIADQPIISMGDIITYKAQTHELKLTDIVIDFGLFFCFIPFNIIVSCRTSLLKVSFLDSNICICSGFIFSKNHFLNFLKYNPEQ